MKTRKLTKALIDVKRFFSMTVNISHAQSKDAKALTDSSSVGYTEMNAPKTI